MLSTLMGLTSSRNEMHAECSNSNRTTSCQSNPKWVEVIYINWWMLSERTRTGSNDSDVHVIAFHLQSRGTSTYLSNNHLYRDKAAHITTITTLMHIKIVKSHDVIAGSGNRFDLCLH